MPAEIQRGQEQQESNQELLVQQAERILTEIPQTLNKIEERIDKIIANDYFTRFVVFLEYLRLRRMRQNIKDRLWLLRTTLPSGRSSLLQEEIAQFREIFASSKKNIDALFGVDDNNREQREQREQVVSQLSRLNAKITGVVAFFKYLDQPMSTDLIKSSISHSQLPIGEVDRMTLEDDIVAMIQMFSLLRSIQQEVSLPQTFQNLLDLLNQIDTESILSTFGISRPPTCDYLQIEGIPNPVNTRQETFILPRLHQLVNLMVAQYYGYIKLVDADNKSVRFTKRYAGRYPKLLTDLKEMNAIEFFNEYVLSKRSLHKRCQGQSPADIISLLEKEI